MRMHFLACLLALLVGCQSPSGSEVDVYNYGDELELKLGEEAIIGTENSIVEFVDVLEDSRCPVNVMCFWAGNGKVQIRFAYENVRLNTYLEPHDTTVSDVNIQLLNLQPYPEHPLEIEKDDYKVRLLIRKNKIYD